MKHHYSQLPDTSLSLFNLWHTLICTFLYVLQQFTMKPCYSTDCISQFSVDSYTSVDSKDPVYIAAGDIRRRLSENMAPTKSKFEVSFMSVAFLCDALLLWNKFHDNFLISYFSCHAARSRGPIGGCYEGALVR